MTRWETTSEACRSRICRRSAQDREARTTIAHPIFTCTRLGTRITGRPSPVTGESCPGNWRSQASTLALQLGVDDDVDVPPCLWEGTYVGSLVPCPDSNNPRVAGSRAGQRRGGGNLKLEMKTPPSGVDVVRVAIVSLTRGGVVGQLFTICFRPQGGGWGKIGSRRPERGCTLADHE